MTAAAAGALVAFGSYQAWRGVQIRRYCGASSSFDDPNYDVYCTTPFGGDPFVGAIVSSSLALALSAPIAVAGGLLLRRGVLIRRAWRQARPKVSVHAWPAGWHGGGLSIGGAF